MSRKRQGHAGKASDVTDNGLVSLNEEQLAKVSGGAGRLSSDPDGDQQAENVTLNFAKVKYVYTPQK